jgi:hypothetical protein
MPGFCQYKPINGYKLSKLITLLFRQLFLLLKAIAADATDAPQPSRLIVQPCDEDDVCFCFSTLMVE